jgi:signal transduction histidine kinase
MSGMIDDLLTLAVVNAEVKADPCDLEEILRDTLHMFEDRIRESRASVESDGLPVVNGVASQLALLFQNLIGNALKFSRNDVAPRIRLSHTYRTPEETTQLGLRPAEKYLEISFTDNGIGFNDKHAERIFAIFQRLHLREEYEGTGIGLAICRKIVRNHGGVISATGKQGVGAVFTVILPS